MKARTKTEKEVERLSQRMGEIGERDKSRLIAKTYGTSKNYMDWYDRCYVVINQSYYNWQVLRYFRIQRHRNRQRQVSYDIWEVFQLWNKVGCKQVLIARQRCMGLYLDKFVGSSKLEIRRIPTNCYFSYLDVNYAYIYDKSLKGTYHYADAYVDKLNLYPWYRFLSCDKFAETIVKMRPQLAAYMVIHEHTSKEAINAVRIAIRHNYEIISPARYFDLIKMLKKLGCDLNNPHFVCPENFDHTHAWALEACATDEERRRRAQRRAEEIEDMRKKEKENEKYIERRKKFYDMEITDGTISCKVLKNVQEFYEEGNAMHHCVYACKYYEKSDSLIMSARIDDKRIETVEFSLVQGKVVQCYGACDKFTIYHDRIVKLVNDNIDMIYKYNNSSKQIAI